MPKYDLLVMYRNGFINRIFSSLVFVFWKHQDIARFSSLLSWPIVFSFDFFIGCAHCLACFDLFLPTPFPGSRLPTYMYRSSTGRSCTQLCGNQPIVEPSLFFFFLDSPLISRKPPEGQISRFPDRTEIIIIKIGLVDLQYLMRPQPLIDNQPAACWQFLP